MNCSSNKLFSYEQCVLSDKLWNIFYKTETKHCFIHQGFDWSYQDCKQTLAFPFAVSFIINNVSFLKESLAQSIIFNTTILVKWIKIWLNFHFPNALRWVDMFSVLIALKVWTHNGWFYTYTAHIRCIWIMWVGEADGATNNYRGNTFSYWHQNILPLVSYGSSFCHFM